ncbi:MAG TPA: TatD family hydrolase, partial [Tepidisphaeraceae bacterium]|nr:TatD family hydrolase [Tepidisphaeraceae bacterium]
MIDSHCHLTDPRLSDQLEAVLGRAASAGIQGMITIGTTPDDAQAAITLCQERKNVRCAVGLHPNYSHEVPPARWAELETLLRAPEVLAAGEMGLDYHWDFADRAIQRRALEYQLSLAKTRNLPVVIHCRNAVDDTLAILRGGAMRGVFHCFTGTIDESRRIIEAGFHIGFTGPITFKRSDELRQIVRETPRDRLLVETDAPYLTPEPHRKIKINEPAFVIHVADEVARQWDVSRDE